jgi:hypothetical protein
MKNPRSTLWIQRAQVFLLIVMTGGAQAQPITPASVGSWLMFLRQASDDSTAPQEVAYYQELFDPSNPDMLDTYFKEMSFGKVSVKAPKVFSWFRPNVTSAELKARINPTRDVTLAPVRTKLNLDA